MILVLDTDVVLSGLRSTVGASRVLLLAVAAGAATPLVSVATVLEYEAVLTRPANLRAIGLDMTEVGRFLDDFIAHARAVAVEVTWRPSVRDPDDEVFFDLAVNGAADALVSFNRADYRPLHPSQPAPFMPVLTPGETLRRLPWRPSAISPFVFPPRSLPT